MAEIGLNDQVQVTMLANQWLQLLGWIQAKRPDTEWDPPFVQNILAAIQHSMVTPDDDDA